MLKRKCIRFRLHTARRRRYVAKLFLSIAFLFSMITLTLFGQSISYRYTGDIHFDVKHVPFSRFGSYLSINDLSLFQPQFRRNGLFLRTVHQDGMNAFQFKLSREGKMIPFETSATPTLLTMSADNATVEISFQGPDQLRIRGHGATLQLIAASGWTVADQQGHWELNTSAMKYKVLAIKGVMQAVANEEGDDHGAERLTISPESDGQTYAAEIDAYTSGWKSHQPQGSFEDAQKGEQAAFRKWLDTMPRVEPRFGQGAELAAYVNWESVVAANGNFKRPAMLMSKNWMESVWSWDHAFNAMATSLSDPRLAWDQLLLPFDVQDEEGALPDKWNADSVAWEFSKPPIQGWALTWMLHRGNFQDRKHLEQIYPPLSMWTKWYFRYRDPNHTGMPIYRHGNESGWDNSTVFGSAAAIESPDLAAYLSLQMDVLAHVAARLGKLDESRQWRRRSDQLLNLMLKRFWRDGEFVAVRVSDGSPIHSKSLLLCMPIILGDRLPVAVRMQLVASLKRRALDSRFGLPSEPVGSRFYEADGYWRGPIWAPSTLIITSSLDEMGEHALALALKNRFCEMAQRIGMAENFNAETGEALRDAAYTWTSSVFLILANELATKR